MLLEPKEVSSGGNHIKYIQEYAQRSKNETSMDAGHAVIV